MKLLNILILLISINCFAKAVKLDKGETAPFKGALITEERLQKYDQAERKIPSLERIIFHSEDNIEKYRVRLKKTETELSRVQTKAYLGTLGGFLLGVVITSVAAKAALESTR